MNVVALGQAEDCALAHGADAGRLFDGEHQPGMAARRAPQVLSLTSGVHNGQAVRLDGDYGFSFCQKFRFPFRSS